MFTTKQLRLSLKPKNDLNLFMINYYIINLVLDMNSGHIYYNYMLSLGGSISINLVDFLIEKYAPYCIRSSIKDDYPLKPCIAYVDTSLNIHFKFK